MEARCVIFDCDGVVIDSEIISAQVLIHKLAQCGIQIDMLHVQQHFWGISFSAVKAKIKAQFGVELAETFESDYRQALLAEFKASLKLTPGFLEILHRIQVPYCIATSSSKARNESALATVGLTKWFEGRAFTAEQVQRGKPEPDLFLYAAQQMQIAPEHCLVIEDSIYGIEAAQKAGMIPLHYRGGEHLKNGPTKITQQYPNIEVLERWQQLEPLYPSLFESSER